MPVLTGQRRTGALLLLGVGAAFALALTLRHGLDGERTVRARFTDASSLAATGTAVRLAGTPVGRVTGVERDGDSAILTMELDHGARDLRADATAELRPRLPFEGTAYVDLHPGHAAAPLGDRTIDLRHTHVATSFGDVLRVLRPPTRADIRVLSRAGAAALGGHTPGALQHTLRTAPGLLRDAGTLARAFRGADADDLRLATAGLARTARAVASRDADLVPILRTTARTAGALDVDGGAPLDRALLALPPTLAAVRADAGPLSGILTDADAVARDARPAFGPARRALFAAVPLLRRAAPVLRAATPLAGDLDRALRAGAAAAPPATAALHALAPAGRTAARSLVPALTRRTSLGPPAYVEFLNLFAGGGGASAPFQASGDGPPPLNMGAGHFMRFGLRFLTGIGEPAPPCTLLQRADPRLATIAATAGACTP